MDRKVRQLAFGLMGCFVLLFAAMNYWQVGREWRQRLKGLREALDQGQSALVARGHASAAPREIDRDG